MFKTGVILPTSMKELVEPGSTRQTFSIMKCRGGCKCILLGVQAPTKINNFLLILYMSYDQLTPMCQTFDVSIFLDTNHLIFIVRDPGNPHFDREIIKV
jgi:hypothetical protein